MKRKEIKYVIVSPRNIRGGAIVLHELCRELVRQGCSAKIFYIQDAYYRKKNQYWKKWIKFTWEDMRNQFEYLLLKRRAATIPRFQAYSYAGVTGCKRKYLPFVGKNTVVIYPEIVYGNPLRGKKVVRWFLSFNKYVDDDDAYGKKDLFFAYRSVFNDKKLNPKERTLCISYWDFNLYRNYNHGKREGICYIIHKGRTRSDIPKLPKYAIVDDLPEEKKVEIFNQCEYCYCYDTQTAYASLAALCGCVTVIIPEEGKSRKDYRTEDDVALYGTAFGFDKEEIEYAKETMPLVKEDLEKIVEDGKKSVTDFIRTCKIHYKVI